MHRKALGRGLDALIPGANTSSAGPGVGIAEERPESGLREVAIDEISANPYQPRTRFDDDAIRELAASIRATGVLQPVIVRKTTGDAFQLVAGERRLRAAQFAGLSKIPALIRDVDDREMMELALVENVQREDLNPIDEARAYQTLVEKLSMTHDQVSERVGKQRVSITNALRLLALPAEVQDMVSRETISAGHARALLALETAGDQLAAARYVTSKGFSVRRTEAFVRRRLRRQHSRPRSARTEALGEWSVKLQQKFGTHVTITPGRKGGRVEFQYFGQDDLERLFQAWGIL
jgi:ParB family transcriptional regulator, chromosome partitioning protein